MELMSLTHNDLIDIAIGHKTVEPRDLIEGLEHYHELADEVEELKGKVEDLKADCDDYRDEAKDLEEQLSTWQDKAADAAAAVNRLIDMLSEDDMVKYQAKIADILKAA